LEVFVLSLTERKLRRIVVKFGGSSLADGAGIMRAAEMVAREAERGTQIAVVVSAMGKTTDQLIETANEACGGKITGRELDDIMAMGERTSARIFSAALKAKGLRSLFIDPSSPEWPIITDKEFNNANPIMPICKSMIREHLQPLLDEGYIVVVPGFIGKTEDDEITTLGRGGSDVTALILAQALSADQVILVTDVEGIMTADPKLVNNTERLESIPIDALVGLADSGTKFLHKKALMYKSPKIDVKVIRNTSGDLRSEGTIIYGALRNSLTVEPHREPSMAVTIVGRAITESPEVVREILQGVRDVGVRLLGVSVNHNSVILYLPMARVKTVLDRLHSIVVENEETIAMAVRRNLAFIRVRGVGLEETPGVISGISEALNSSGINIYGIFTITSSVLVFVDLEDGEKAVELIKKAVEGMKSTP